MLRTHLDAASLPGSASISFLPCVAYSSLRCWMRTRYVLSSSIQKSGSSFFSAATTTH